MGRKLWHLIAIGSFTFLAVNEVIELIRESTPNQNWDKATQDKSGEKATDGDRKGRG